MIREKLRSWLGIPEQRDSLELNVDDNRLMSLLGIDHGGMNVRGKRALKVETVYSCIKILSESVSKLPVKVYREDDNGIQMPAKHPLYQLLRLRPNPLMSASDFWKCVEAERCFGNAYVYIDFDQRAGRVNGLWPIDRNKVTVWIDDAGLLSGAAVGVFAGAGTKLWYEVETGSKRVRLMPHEVLHFKGSVTLDGIIGVNPIDYLKTTIENAGSAAKFINNFYRQGLQVKGLVQYTGTLDEPAKKVFRENFESMAAGLNNSHRIALMPIGYQFTPMSLSMADAQFLQNAELTIRQIAAAFGVKMHQINELTQATFNNVEQQQTQFYGDTLQPILTGYEQEMTFKLFMDDELNAGYYLRFNVDAILRADLKTRYEAYRIGVQGGFITPNEPRRLENLPPKEGGDELYVNGSVVPLTQAGAAYAKSGKRGDGTDTGEEEPDQGDQGATGEAGDPGDGGRGK